MPRATNNPASKHRRKRIRARAKGFYGAPRTTIRVGRHFTERAMAYEYRDRKVRKREFRKLWIERINAAARINGISYSHFIDGLKKAQITIDRKVLADLAVHDAQGFARLAEVAKNAR